MTTSKQPKTQVDNRQSTDSVPWTKLRYKYQPSSSELQWQKLDLMGYNAVTHSNRFTALGWTRKKSGRREAEACLYSASPSRGAHRWWGNALWHGNAISNKRRNISIHNHRSTPLLCKQQPNRAQVPKPLICILELLASSLGRNNGYNGA